MSEVVGDKWVEKVVDAALAKFLENPKLWPGDAARLDTPALKNLVEEMRTRLRKSPQVVGEAKRWRMVYCNGAFQRLAQYQQTKVVARLSNPAYQKVIGELLALTVSDLTPQQLLQRAPQFDAVNRVLKRFVDLHGAPGAGQQQANRQQAKRKVAREGAVAEARTARDRAFLIGARLVRYQRALASHTPNDTATALLLFRELYGSLKGWLVAHETGGIIDAVDATYPVEMQAFKTAFKKNGDSYVVRGDYTGKGPQKLRAYAPDWDRSNPNAVADWLWRANGRDLPIDGFLSAYPTDVDGEGALEKLLIPEGDADAEWVLSGKAFDALARARDYYTGAVFKRTLKAEECLSAMQQGAAKIAGVLAAEKEKEWPSPWTQENAAKFDAISEAAVEKKFPRYPLRTLLAEAQIGKLKTIGSGTRYAPDIILSATSARDPWISLEMLSGFVNDRLQIWDNAGYWRLWGDASEEFLKTARDWNTVEIREDGTIVTRTSKSFYPWTLEVTGGEGFYQYRTWTASVEMWGGDAHNITRPGVPSAADLLAYKLPGENTDEFLKKLSEENKTTLWTYEAKTKEWVPRKIGEKEWKTYLQNAANANNPPVHVDPIQDIIDGVPPLWLEADPKGGYVSADAQGCSVPRIIPYGALSTGGDKTGNIGYDSKLPGFSDSFRNGMSTRARFYLGFLNDDYTIFNPSSRTGIAVLKQMFKFRGTGSKPANEAFNDEGGLYSVPWPASRSWVGLADSPPTSTDQAHAQKDPMTSDYDGGLRALSLPKAGLMNMGEILQGAYDAQNNLAKGFFSIGLLWRMTRGKSGANKVALYGSMKKAPLGKASTTGSGKVGLSPLVPSMYWFEVRNDIPEASPALTNLGVKLKSQRKLERIGLYTFLFNESFRGWVGETAGASGALAERYNANWVGYRPRDYSSVKETGSKSLSKSLMRWSGGAKKIQLYDYQSDAVLRMDDQQGGLLAFDVGVGKTLCALAAIAYARQNGTARRILCVVPNTIQRQWLQEFQGRLPDYNVVILGQTLRAPSKIQKNSPVWEDFVEMAHKGNRDDSKGALGGWLWRAVRDHKMPQFEKEKIPWRGKGKSGWREVEAEAKLISQQLLLQGGSVAQDFAYLVAQMSPTHSAKKFPGVAMQYQKSTREERAQRWIAFSEGQYDAMICSEVDFATIAMKPDTLRKHLRASPSLRAMLVNQTFKGSSSAAGGGLRQQLSVARKALKEWRTSQSSGWTPTPADVRTWILDVTFGTAPQGVTVSLPPHLGIPMGNFTDVGAALRAYLKKGIYEMENFSGPFWDETVEKFTSELFGPARDKPDEKARAEYAQLFEEPLYWVIADANGNLVLTNGSPKNWNWFKRNKVHYPDYGPRDYKGDSRRYPSVFRFDDPPFRPAQGAGTTRGSGSGSEWDNGTVPLAWASMGVQRSSFVYPDGVGAGKSSAIVALDYQHAGDPLPKVARYSKLDKGWMGKPVGFVSAGDFAKQVAATMSAQWAGSGKKTLQNVFQGYDISTNEPLKKLKGPFHATPLMTYGRGKVGDVPVRLPTLAAAAAGKSAIDQRLAVARDYSMLPKLYDTQPAWNLPPTLYFEDLQVDCIICDEAHKYKALFSPRERGGKVAYLQSGQQSKRAWAMEARTSNIKERNGRVMLLTATPAKTSPLEFYNVMQLIGAPGLGGDLSVFSQFGIYTSEQFISRFVKIEDTIIIDADGTTRRGAAATAFVNLDKEFTAIFHRYANRKTVLDVKTLRGTQVGKGQGAVYQAGEPEILIPKGDLSKLTIGDRFQLVTGDSKGGYRVQGFLPGTTATNRGGVVIMPPPDKDSSSDTVLKGDHWVSYTAGKVPLGPPPAVVDVPLTEDQRNLYGGFQKALSGMILEDRNRAVVKVGGQELLTTKKLKVYPSMSRLTLHEQLETYTFEVEIIDTTTRQGSGDVQTKRAVSNRFAQGLALGLEVDVDPVDTLMDYYRRGVGPWAFFGAPAPTDQGVLAQTGGLTSTIPVLSPAYKKTLSGFKGLAERVRRASRAIGQQQPIQPEDLLNPQEEVRYAEIAAEFHPDKKESDRQNWAKPFMKVAGHRYVGSLKLHSKTGVLLNPGGVTNTVTGTLQPKDVINVASPRLCAMIDRVLARSVMDVHTATNVTCGNIAFCGNLYIHAWTVIYWTRLYALTKLFQCWAKNHVSKGFDPNAGPWIDALEYYGMVPLYWTTANVLRIALPKADFTLTPSTVTANNQEDATLLAVEIMEFVIAGEEEEGYVGEAAAYRQATSPVPLFSDFRVLHIRPQAQPLKDAFDGYYIEGANKIAVMNSEVAPGPSRQDITDKFNGEWGKDKEGGDCAVKKPEFDLLVANSVAYEGVDLQARTCAIHHLDLPWTPSDFIQRQGRGVRQGNLFEVVDSYVYLSRNTVDYFRLQALERKRAWLESALDADSPTFELASNEAELLQLACQSVHPDDVEAVCRKAAQKLSEIKREKLIKEFNPLKGMVRGCAFNALVAFVWHSVGIQRSNAENKYKEFLHGARVLREPDTRLMLEPFVVEPSLVDQLQDGLLVGADPENIQQGLDNLNPPSVGISPSSEDPSDYSPVPIAIEGSFLAPVIVADNASILQIPGAKPVILRPDAISGQNTGEWPQGTPTAVALPFGGLYLGVSVKHDLSDWPGQMGYTGAWTSTVGQSAEESRRRGEGHRGAETVWVLDVPPRAHADPSIYFEDESLVGPGEKLGKADVRPHALKGLHEGRPLGGWKRVRIHPTDADNNNPQWESLQGYASTKVPVVLDALQSAWQQGPQFGSTKTQTSTFPYAPNYGGRNLSEKHIRRLGPGKDGDGKEIEPIKLSDTRDLSPAHDERTWVDVLGVRYRDEVVIPYNTGIWESLAEQKLIDGGLLETESIFKASILWQRETNYHAPHLPFRGHQSKNSFVWLSGAATPWIQSNWDELTALICLEWMQFIWERGSIVAWKRALKQAGTRVKGRTRMPGAAPLSDPAPWFDPRPLDQILVDAYDLLVPLSTDIINWKGEVLPPEDPATAAEKANQNAGTAQWWGLKRMDDPVRIPWMVGSKLWISTARKLTRSSSEMHRLLLSGTAANWFLRQRLAEDPYIDPAKVVVQVNTAKAANAEDTKERKKATAALGRVNDKTYKNWAKLSDAEKQQTREAVENTLEAVTKKEQDSANELELGQHLRELLASQAVSIIEPTLPGLKEFAAVVPETEGVKGRETTELGTVSYDEVKVCTRYWWHAYGIHGSTSPWSLEPRAFAAKGSPFYEGYTSDSSSGWDRGAVREAYRGPAPTQGWGELSDAELALESPEQQSFPLGTDKDKE